MEPYTHVECETRSACTIRTYLPVLVRYGLRAVVLEGDSRANCLQGPTCLLFSSSSSSPPASSFFLTVSFFLNVLSKVCTTTSYEYAAVQTQLYVRAVRTYGISLLGIRWELLVSF